jgi:DNA-3-methyladenine glycosylase
MFQVKRVYDDPDDSDGFRVLVDRLWPRGLSKERAHLDEWLKDVAPSNELRKWFGHDRLKFDEFVARYHAELDKNPAVQALLELGKKHPTVCLLYSAHDTQANQAVALRDYLMTASAHDGIGEPR